MDRVCDEEDGAVAAAFAAALLARLTRRHGGSVLWCLQSDDLYAPGLAAYGLPPERLIVARCRDDTDILWAMEEGLRCSALSCVIGEIWGDPRALDFTATRRLAVAAERSRVPCWLVRLVGTANLSGARMRWRIASATSLLNELDARAPGAPAWDAELFRARGSPPGRWSIAHEAGAFHLVAPPGDRALGEIERLSA